MLKGYKVLVMGLPGAGKTTLAREVAKTIGAVHWNADDVRAKLSADLTFSVEDRVRQAERMGWLCDHCVASGVTAIADFVCPTEACRTAFGAADLVVWMDTIAAGRFRDTNDLFEPPASSIRILALAPGNATRVVGALLGIAAQYPWLDKAPA